MPVVSLARCVGRGGGGVGVGMGHASLASYGGGRHSRAGKERASLARCVGKGVGGVGVGMGHASLASYGGGRLDESWEGTRIASTLCRQGRWRGW